MEDRQQQRLKNKKVTNETEALAQKKRRNYAQTYGKRREIINYNGKLIESATENGNSLKGNRKNLIMGEKQTVFSIENKQKYQISKRFIHTKCQKYLKNVGKFLSLNSWNTLKDIPGKH